MGRLLFTFLLFLSPASALRSMADKWLLGSGFSEWKLAHTIGAVFAGLILSYAVGIWIFFEMQIDKDVKIESDRARKKQKREQRKADARNKMLERQEASEVEAWSEQKEPEQDQQRSVMQTPSQQREPQQDQQGSVMQTPSQQKEPQEDKKEDQKKDQKEEDQKKEDPKKEDQKKEDQKKEGQNEEQKEETKKDQKQDQQKSEQPPAAK